MRQQTCWATALICSMALLDVARKGSVAVDWECIYDTPVTCFEKQPYYPGLWAIVIRRSTTKYSI